MTDDEWLLAAWKHNAPGCVDQYPRGFWPDVARVAMAMKSQNTITPVLDFQPTRAARPAAVSSKLSRAENTARLLALIEAKGTTS